ncbi:MULTISPECIES: type II toxin-antitoxin system PemK/MazF family toxin [unclassified Streptomyces]|uniref:type II toxin-antitoxin system PemK/MazF family toxin n=1 Tax=unclassified Streptomyces TaxID=2593676 RepID=UPI00224F195D|nr:MULTISPECIES: type II toxin-antitoxin system PemK/MazF family toxin [unclassified Streptomyces]MCX5332350.1 type II toxin-antitoxin system PemK/MazF family toxin [Streptomyces sp. NBC_00140]MCX5361729.1 type II toxin-antitoxin system PemK/MazF family toxin [Streptomyces sp. NBC_00124]
MRQLKRGQVWTVPTVGRDRTVVIVQNDHVAELHPGAVLCALLDVSGERRESLVTVRVTAPLRGAVLAPDLYNFRLTRFEQGKYHGDVPAEQMERVDIALRAVLSL